MLATAMKQLLQQLLKCFAFFILAPSASVRLPA